MPLKIDQLDYHSADPKSALRIAFFHDRQRFVFTSSQQILEG